MVVFSPAKTKRLNVSLKELTIGDAMYLAKMPGNRYEAGTGELLKRIVQPCEKPRVGQVVDVGRWTVQERAFVVGHYLAHIAADGPDFSIGDFKYSDYLMTDSSEPADIDLGFVAGDKWRLVPLIGEASEAVERMVFDGRLDSGRTGWWFGCMAAQLMRPEENLPVDGDIEEFIASRATVFKSYPESDFMNLLSAYLAGIERQNHLFRISFDDDGVIFLQEVQGNVPARFPFDTAVSEQARKIFS